MRNWKLVKLHCWEVVIMQSSDKHTRGPCLWLQGFKSFMVCWWFLKFKSHLVLLFLMSKQHELSAKTLAFTHLTVVSCVSTVQHWESLCIHVKMTSCASVQQKKTKFPTSTPRFTWKTRSRSGRWMRYSASSATLYPFRCILVSGPLTTACV